MTHDPFAFPPVVDEPTPEPAPLAEPRPPASDDPPAVTVMRDFSAALARKATRKACPFCAGDRTALHVTGCPRRAEVESEPTPEPEGHQSSDGCWIPGPPGEACGCQSCRHTFGPPSDAKRRAARRPARVAGIPCNVKITLAELWDFLSHSAREWKRLGNPEQAAKVLAYRDVVFAGPSGEVTP